MRTSILMGFLAAALAAGGACAEPVKIVAAENFYGDIARQIGGADVAVTSILSNPEQDPHLFEISPSVGRSVAAAAIVVYNGIDYDPWMAKLLRASHAGRRKVLIVADLLGRKPGDNPHVWYDPASMPALAKSLAEMLAADNPARRQAYGERLALFLASMQALDRKVAGLRRRLAGTPVTATEPIFGYMFEALGMPVRNRSFQLAVMNDTEPTAGEMAAFENDLRRHQVKLLVYNSQAASPIAARMERIARGSQIPVVGASETEPPGKNYQAWMSDELDAIDRALP